MKKNKRFVSVFKLIFQSFKVANQVFSSAFFLSVLVTISALFCALLIVGLGRGLYASSSLLLIAVTTLGGFILYCVGTVFNTGLIQIISDRINGTGFGTFEAFKAAFIPSVYTALDMCLLSIVWLFLIVGPVLSGNMMLMLVVLTAGALAMLPFLFVRHAMMLRGTGPIEGLRYSWNLSIAHYVTLIRVFLVLLFILIALVVLGTIFFPILMANLPQLKAQILGTILTGSLPKLGPIALLAMGFGYIVLNIILPIYMTSVVYAFTTGLFLELDAIQFMPAELDPLDAQAHTPMSHMPTQAAPAKTPSASKPQAAAVPQLHPEEIMQDLSVTQSSIDTHPDDETIRHLDAVYSAQEHLAQAVEQEEDRMPTILFDEEMARQLEENERKMRQQHESKARKDEEDGHQSIKISKGQL